MEATSHRRPPGLFNQHKRERTLRKKEVHAARSWDKTSPCSYNHDPSPPHDRHTEVVSKAPSKLSWWNDRDLSRKRRVVKYKLYAVPGKLKSSFQKGFHHLKMTCKKILA